MFLLHFRGPGGPPRAPYGNYGPCVNYCPYGNYGPYGNYDPPTSIQASAVGGRINPPPSQGGLTLRPRVDGLLALFFVLLALFLGSFLGTWESERWQPLSV